MLGKITPEVIFFRKNTQAEACTPNHLNKKAEGEEFLEEGELLAGVGGFGGGFG